MPTIGYNPDRCKTFTASGAIEANRLVILSAAGTVRHAVAGEDADGVAVSGAATTASVTVQLRNAQGTHPAVASGAVSVGDLVYCDAAGKVTATRNGLPYGKALTAASNDGDQIEVEPDFGSGGGLRYGGATVAASTPRTTSGAFDKTVTIPANKIQAGDFIRIRAAGITGTFAGTETAAFKIFLGASAGSGTEVASAAAVDGTSGDIFFLDVTVQCRTAGATGDWVAYGTAISAGASGTAVPVVIHKAAGTDLNTTIANIVSVTATFSSTGESSILNLLTVDVVNGT